ncbi:MAG TPA: 1-deoxy-D-xylulose-5-phosphate reductoisomerase [Bdellovibrionota bacterium]|nr:1-deoxy-D-xylulose-5-phosphate reductoisomerase [Bdellovibrionota bacterium]
MDTRSVAILGSTGSVGTSTLKVVQRYRDRFRVSGLAGGDNIELLAEQIRTISPVVASTKTEEGLNRLKKLLGRRSETRLEYGTEGAEAVATCPGTDVLISAIVGAAGLRPTLAAARKGMTIGLANKEAMVVAGALVSRTVQESGARFLPVDSEHNAIFQALGGAPRESVRKLILTASGGPFFRQPELDLSSVKPAQALAHPNWKMGSKITIDSATMMNKGLEIIEAHWLFGLSSDRIDVVVHPQSVIHSMVEFIDGSIIAQLGVPDMCGPIAYAMAYPNRLDGVMESLNLTRTRELTFFEPDNERFPSMDLAREALQKGETYPAALNGANEVTVQAFLDEKIRFTDIARINREVLLSYRQTSSKTLEDFISADTWGRQKASDLITEKGTN